MFVEIVDALRCPRAHEESWLVLAASRTELRHVVDGTLGCPVCRAEYPIRDGVADFRAADQVTPGAASVPSADAARLVEAVPADVLAALLDLGDALGFAVLIGEWGRRADALVELGPMPPLLLVDPPAGVAAGPGVSGIRCGADLPLAAGAARAVALDDPEAARLASAVRALRTGGRVVVPAAAPVPDGVRELVRDERVWVGERAAPPSPLVRLHVRRG